MLKQIKKNQKQVYNYNKTELLERCMNSYWDRDFGWRLLRKT